MDLLKILSQHKITYALFGWLVFLLIFCVLAFGMFYVGFLPVIPCKIDCSKTIDTVKNRDVKYVEELKNIEKIKYCPLSGINYISGPRQCNDIRSDIFIIISYLYWILLPGLPILVAFLILKQIDKKVESKKIF